MRTDPHPAGRLARVQVVALHRVAAASVEGDPPGRAAMRGLAGGRAGAASRRGRRLPPQPGPAGGDGDERERLVAGLLLLLLAVQGQQDDRVRLVQARPGGVDSRGEEGARNCRGRGRGAGGRRRAAGLAAVAASAARGAAG